LSGANLSKADLSKANLSRANLDEADLSEAILRETLLPMIGHNIATSTPNPSHPSPNSSIEKPTIFLMSGAERTKEHPQQIYILYCYTPTPQDRKLRDQLETHLMVLKRLKQITLRLNREIPIGVNWKEVQDERFHLADLILLLISPDFIASDYHYGIEMHNALEKHKAGNVWVIPILLRPTPLWQQTPLGTLQVLPRNGKAITDHPKRDQVLADITREIGEVVSRLLKRYPSLQAANTSKATHAIGPFCISCGARNPPNTPVCENCGDIL
jgi:Pentapeptide repeats (8 copies)